MKRLGIFVLICVTGSTVPAADPVDFNRDVRPILSNRCFQCHGPDEDQRQAELRLDRHEGPDGAWRERDGERVIVPGQPDASLLWQRITGRGDQQMPPEDSDKDALDASEREIIRRWISEGADYAAFWAFVPPRRSTVESGVPDEWNQNAIDRILWPGFANAGLKPRPEADRRTLVRRLSLDLTGLPPSPQDIANFLDDQSPQAYEHLVDRLLSSPHYGEHQARYWLDLVRFADTNGIHHDHFRDFSPYRDWVIRAFNENLGYDDFIRFQLAGDLYEEPTRDQLIASGFNRLHLIIDRGTALPEESFTRNVIDRVTAVGTAFMGLTVQCAVCHDHKYDPITSRDFYQLYAFFNNFDGEPETGGRRGTDFQRGLQPPYLRLASEEEKHSLGDFQNRIQQLDSQLKTLRDEIKKADEPDRKKDLESRVKQLEQQRKEVASELTQLEAAIPVAMIMKERAERRPAHVLIRGEYDNPGDEVLPGTPAFLPGLPGADSGALDRLDLAEWLVMPDHPLTARVAVNRFWQQLFGIGIVKTSEDFGAQGEWPSHPQLLDELAVAFVESGWDTRELIRTIVLSRTYRQSSEASPEAYTADPENRRLARGSRFRLDAEVIRDQILASSGLLNRDLYGPSVKPPQPDGLWETVTMPSSYPRTYVADTGNRIYRRSLYTFWKRGMPPPQMTILNAPTREACTARRERTNTPLQALLLMNEPEFFKAARHLALDMLEKEGSDEQRIGWMYERTTGMLPQPVTGEELQRTVSDFQSIYAKNPTLAEKLCGGIELPESVTRERLAAWTMLASTLQNLDRTRTRE